MSEFFVYPEDLSDVEESSSTATSLNYQSFSEENYSFNQEVRTIIENEINNLKNNKSSETKTHTNNKASISKQ